MLHHFLRTVGKVAFSDSYWTELSYISSYAITSVACSSTGTYIIFCTSNNYIYTSSDSGANFTARTSPGEKTWKGVACSADGTKMFAVSDASDYIYKSTDNGVTWSSTRIVIGYDPTCVACSSDGTYVVVGGTGARPYTSNDGGATWTQSGGSTYNWYGLTISDNGQKIVGVANAVYVSTDGGATWTYKSTGTNMTNIAGSTDGTKLVAADYGGYFYTSADSGANWTQRTGAGARNWEAVASSDDGTKLAACINGSSVFTSTDSGATWTERFGAGERAWRDITAFADGSKFIAADYNQLIVSP